MIIEDIFGKLFKVNKNLITAVTLIPDDFYKSKDEVYSVYLVHFVGFCITVSENEQKKILEQI